MNQTTYSWQKAEENKFYLWHTEGDHKTQVAITDTAEKAHFLATAANLYNEHQQFKQEGEKYMQLGKESQAAVINDAGFPKWYEDNYRFDGQAGFHVHKITGEKTGNPYELYLKACNAEINQQ